MDAKEFSEGQYITPKLVTDAQNRIAVILGEAKAEETKYGKQLTVNVEFNKSIKTWRLNKDSVTNMLQLGTDTMTWVGKAVLFSVVTVGGKERVIGSPLVQQPNIQAQIVQ